MIDERQNEARTLGRMRTRQILCSAVVFACLLATTRAGQKTIVLRDRLGRQWSNESLTAICSGKCVRGPELCQTCPAASRNLGETSGFGYGL